MPKQPKTTKTWRDARRAQEVKRYGIRKTAPPIQKYKLRLRLGDGGQLPSWFPKYQKHSRSEAASLYWKLRTGRYSVGLNGVFTGFYMRPRGQLMLVRGNWRARIRYERPRGARPRRWHRVTYSDPRRALLI